MLRTHDDWERLVGAVIKKQQLWELCHAHSRSSSEVSEASSSDIVQKLVLVSDFVPAFDVEDAKLNSLELIGTGTVSNTYAGDVSDEVKIVVKRLNKSVSISEEQFKRSMDVIARVWHENVVALRAYYCSEDEKLMMYDYCSEGSVYDLLHGQASEIPPQVSWETRLRIAIGVARGLASIHAQHGGQLVHGNIKSTNIFINHENYGSISDFGMINLMAAKFRQNECCHAPEVKNTRGVSQESDVYSFGVLLFELLTRKRSVGPNPVDLVKLMKSVKNTNMTSKVFDAYLLEDRTIREHMVRVLQIGISCVVQSVKKRPKMSQVAKMLEDLYMLLTNDDWERLVGAITKEQQLWELSQPGMFLLGDLWVKGDYVHPKRPRLQFVDQNDGFELTDDPFDLGDPNPFSLEDLLRAYADILGKGTFGSSSEGFFKVSLENGIVVMVKRMKDMNVMTSEKFKRHMYNIGKFKHVNCAKLLAYYFFKDEGLLVYDHFDHGSLSDLLHGTRKPLAWDTRLRIVFTAAKGIAHIHGLMHVHGSIKSSNIFVDRYNNAIITDTALWKFRKSIPSSVLRHECYLAPEVVRDTRNVSQASDVYSFGVVLLELLTRRSPQVTLVSLARKLTYKVLDPELRGCVAMKKLLQLAMDCVEDAPERRPKMNVAVKRLDEISGIYEEECEPSMYFDSEDVGPWIGSRLEDALEVQLSSLTIIEQR